MYDEDEILAILSAFRHPERNMELILRLKQASPCQAETVTLPDIFSQMLCRFIIEILLEDRFGSFSITSEAIQKGLTRVRVDGGSSSQSCISSEEIFLLKKFIYGYYKSQVSAISQHYLMNNRD